MTKPIVQVTNLNKTIKGKQIIKDVNLTFYPGEITGFLGPNGAGKTTTIRMMTGLMHPTSGTILIDGYNLKTDYEKAIQNVGVIVENPEMYKYMSGYKNLLHFARMHKLDQSRIAEVVAQVGLEKRIHEKVKTYSLGMRQRLGLAQALLHRPKFLILDEPTNGLDPAGIREFRQHLRKIAKEQNVAIMISSHLLAEIELMVDRIIVIQNGAIIDTRDLNTQQTTTHYIEVEQREQFIQLVGEENITPHENGYLLAIEREQVPALLRQLVEAQIDVYSIHVEQQNLEDQFIEMTGGGAIDAIN